MPLPPSGSVPVRAVPAGTTSTSECKSTPNSNVRAATTAPSLATRRIPVQACAAGARLKAATRLPTSKERDIEPEDMEPEMEPNMAASCPKFGPHLKPNVESQHTGSALYPRQSKFD